MTRSARFAAAADRVLPIAGSSTPVMTASNFGSRLSGYIVPERDGDYQFALTADDAGELWFSPDEHPSNRELIAFCDVWRAPERWNAVAAQQSKPVTLRAGQAYYFEILHKDHHAPGRLDLGWRHADSEQSFTAIPAFMLHSPRAAPEAEMRGHLAETWLDLHASKHPDGPDAARRALLPYGNPSGDRIPNWIKARENLDPFTRYERPGGLTREWWFRSPGGSLASALRARHHLRPPSMISHTQGSQSDQDTTDHFLSRLRGTITLPETALVRFWIAGDDHCQLWLSDNARKFHKQLIAHVGPAGFESPDTPAWTDPLDWDARPGQRSREFQLTKGTRRYLEILHKDANGDDHVAVAWQRKLPGQSQWGPREIIPPEFLHAYAGDPDDLDDDYLPDSWEKNHGLDPTDNGIRDPRQGESGDFDGDGLTNHEEYLLGTNPTNPDTDGDGVSDYDEIHTYRSNPLVKDVSPPVERHRFQLSMGKYALNSPWIAGKDGSITSAQRRGAVVLDFVLDEPGIHTVTLKASASGTSDYIPDVPVSIAVNGIQLGILQYPANPTSHTRFTQWLPAGRHQVTVDNLNVRSNVALTIHELILARFEGPDSHGQGIPDWLIPFLDARNTLETPLSETTISPLFVEGTCRTPGSVSLRTHEGEIRPMDHFSGHWHANIPLNKDGSAVAMEIRYEHGAVARKHEIQWKPTNLATAPSLNHVRLGDAIRATAHHHGQADSGYFSLRYREQSWERHPVASPVVIVFEDPGIHHLTATLQDGTAVTTTYHVHHADLGKPFSVAMGESRFWKPADAHSPVEMASGDGWALEALHDDSEDGNELDFLVSNATPVPGTSHLVARLPSGGPILATCEVQSFRIASASHTQDAHLVGVLGDGTRVVEISYIIEGPVPDDLSIWVRLYVTDAVFANGMTWMRLTAADFDENGVARFQVYKAPGEGTPYVCHWILSHADFEDVLQLRPVEP